MLRLTGALLIILSCSAGGFLASQSLRMRCLLLRGIQEGLLALKREIAFANTQLSQALNIAATAAGEGQGLFLGAAERLSAQRGVSAGEAWGESLTEFAASRELLQEEQEILAAFGLGLGLSDAADQLNRLELCRQRLAAAEEAAQLKWENLGKVWRNLGWSAGVILALLLL